MSSWWIRVLMLVMGVLYRRASSSTDLLLRTECGTLGTITIPLLASIWGESERESGVNVRNAGLSLACRRDHYTVLSHFRGPAGSPPHFLRIEELLAETCISVLREKERRRAADNAPSHNSDHKVELRRNYEHFLSNCNSVPLLWENRKINKYIHV